MIIFRADGNAQIGTGHIMRCLSIAEAARELCEECVFINASDDMSSVIRDKGFNNIVLESDYTNPDEEDIINVLSAYNNPIVFVDSYYVSENYLKTIKCFCEKNNGISIYIDDIKKYAYPCNILLNYNIHGNEQEYNRIYEGKDRPTYLVGTEYAPLRREFQSLPNREINEKAKKIFVSTGGSDPENLSVELLKIAKQKEMEFHFIVGAVNKNKDIMNNETRGFENVIIHENVSNISEIMRQCDVAISAAGSTLYELCATQTPTITYVLADNQLPIAKGFLSKEVMNYCGDIRDLGADGLANNLINEALELCNNFNERKKLAEKMKTIVDGCGAKRIINKILEIQ